MKRPCIKSEMSNIGCDSRVIESVTVLSYKTNEEDTLFLICKNTPNHNFKLKSPLFDSKKELSNYLRCATYAIDYSQYYHGNITN